MFLFLIVFMVGAVQAQENPQDIKKETTDCSCKSDELDILWTTADKEVFTKVIFPYGLNSKKLSWWNEVELIVWGPSSKLLSEDEELQGKIKGQRFKRCGIKTSPTACAGNLLIMPIEVFAANAE